MTFAQIYNEVVAIRYQDPNDLARVKNWVNAAELSVWNAAPWVFKRVAPTSLVVASGNRQPAMPADFGKTIRLYDDNGDPVLYMQPDVWTDAFQSDTSSARPAFYTVMNRQIYLAPTPNAAYTYKLAYRRRYAHLNNAQATVAGVMSIDTDTPLWDAEHHYLLVLSALAIGGRATSDLDAEGYQSDADRLLAAMMDELVAGEDNEMVQWGRSDPTDYGGQWTGSGQGW